MWNLFWTFFRIGAFTFGGGYAMMPLIEEELVHRQKILSQEDYLDSLVLAQSFPGVLAVNMSLIVGYRYKKILGGTVCMLGAILPSVIVIILITSVYDLAKDSAILSGFLKGVQPVVAALLVYSVINLSKKLDKKCYPFVLLATSFVLVGILGVSPIFVIIGGGVLSLWKPCL